LIERIFSTKSPEGSLFFESAKFTSNMLDVIGFIKERAQKVKIVFNEVILIYS
jgi:hypothetical protein